ncbi:helix-turn-helix domain-containing protein [[Clostridium] aminophilum]
MSKHRKSAISNYETNSRGVSAEMLTQLSRLFHVSADYILNGDSLDNLDSIVNEAIEILNNLKTDKAKKSALEVLRQIQILEG